MICLTFDVEERGGYALSVDVADVAPVLAVVGNRTMSPNQDTTSVTLSATELTLLLRGIDLKSVRQRKRYRREVA